MSDHERESPEEAREPGEAVDPGAAPTTARQDSFLQRLERQFGEDVDPGIDLPEPSEEESSWITSTSHALVKKLADQVNVGGRYEIKSEIARGGMGAILRIWDGDLRRNLAMKVMHSRQRFDEESGSTEFDQEKLVRFLEEAQITGQLDHPGIVPVHDLGIDDRGRCYFTMRLVRGRELKEILDLARRGEENWTRTKALGLILKVCESMAFAHSKGVVHRDLKPSNIMVGRYGEVYVMDWGLARVLGRADSHDLRIRKAEEASSLSLVRTVRKDDSEANPDSPLVTMDGDVVGTPSFMAVEQAQGKLEEVGPRSDVYSLGAILYYMLTGRSPYVAPRERVSPHTVLNRVLQGPPEPVSKFARDEQAELVAICEKAMHRDAEERYASMLEVAEDIQAYLENRVVRAYEGGALAEFRKWVARNRGMAAALAGMIVLAIASAFGLALQKEKRIEELARGQEAIQAAKDEADASAVEARRNLKLAEQREKEAAANEQRALENELAERRSGYRANVLAANYSLLLHDVEEMRKRLHDSSPILREWEWYHLYLRANGSLDTFGRTYTRPVDAVEWSANGEMLFVLSREGRLRFLDAHTGEALEREPIALAIVSAATFGALTPLELAISGDGRRVAIVGNDPTIRVYDARSSTHLFDIPGDDVVGHEARVGTATFSRDGQYLATGADNGSIILWDAVGEIVRRFPPHDGAVTDLVWSPDSSQFATASADGTVRVWDVRLGRQTGQLLGHQGAVRTLAWDDTGGRLFSGGADGMVNQWSLSRGRLVSTYSGHGAAVRSMDFDTGTGRLVSGADDRTVRVWDPATGEDTVLVGHVAGVLDVAFSPDGSLVVSSDEEGTVNLWDSRGDLSVTDLLFHESSITSLAFSPNGRSVLTGDDRGQLVLWDALSGTPRRRLDAHVGPIEEVAFAPDGETFYSASIDETVKRWRVETGRMMAQFVHDDAVTGLLVLPDGERVLTACGDKTVRLFEADSQLLLDEFVGYRGALSNLALHPDEELFAGTSGNYIVVRDLRGRTHDQKLHRASFFHDCAFGPDGETLVSASMRGEVCVWDLESGETTDFHRDHDRAARAVAFHPDGKRFASAGTDGTIRIREAESGTPVLILSWPDEVITSLAYSPDGTRLMAGSSEGAVRIWETGQVGERRRAWLRESGLRARVGPLVDRLFDETFFLVDVLARLQADRDLTGEERQTAIRLANLRGDDPAVLFERSLSEALVPGNDPEVYEHALDRAEAARSMEGGEDLPVVMLALGMSQYRTGRHAEALTSLERAEELGHPRAGRRRAGRGTRSVALTTHQESVRLLFLAMARHSAGQTALAADALAAAEEAILNHPDLASYRSQMADVLAEAQDLIEVGS
jgi:WD40 repeat protein